MSIIQVNLKKHTNHSYPIEIGSGLLSQLPKRIKELNLYSKIAIITDSATNKLYNGRLKKALAGFKIQFFVFPSGEGSKNQKIKTVIEEAMLKAEFDRKTVIIALGGGVVGDLAGFVAATYMRGIDYIQIPTTILAMVDSSVGGKTGIDTPQGKNLIGAFWQPRLVLADLDFVKSLPQKHLVNGLVEAIKMFLTHDAESFNYSEKNLVKILSRNKPALEKVMLAALKIKTDTIVKDERENGPRMFLNFGHTIGHALEKLSKYKLLHGQAVALGILAEAKISLNLGILSQKDNNRITAFFGKLGFDAKALNRFKPEEIVKLTQSDKKARGGRARYILLEKIGKVYKKNARLAHEVEVSAVKKSLKI